MPTYTYVCEQCGFEFDHIQTMREHDFSLDHREAMPHCPRCDADNVEQRYTQFFAKTSKKT
jgi:putative FmdB family regulatory protein